MKDSPGQQNRTPEPNPAATQEKAEGSRDAQEPQPAAGITNRPWEQEQDEQQQLPPRGERKEDSHA